MAERAEELAKRFAQANGDFIAYIEKIPEERWGKIVGAEDPRPVGVVANHVAWGYAFEQRHFQAMAAGQSLSAVSMAEIDTFNAEHARQWQSLSKGEVLAALRTTGEVVASWVRGLSDEQLERSGEFIVGRPSRTVDQWIERGLIGHIGGHLKDIRATIEV
jgi:hypothetical protein